MPRYRITDHAEVYAITNGTGAVYVGHTTDFAARIARHNSGNGAAFTREHGGHWRAAHRLAVASIAEARCIERYWTAHLNKHGTLPFLGFKPSTWPREHYDAPFLRLARAGLPVPPPAPRQKIARTPAPDLEPQPVPSTRRSVRPSGPSYDTMKPTIRDARAVAADLGFTIERQQRAGCYAIRDAQKRIVARTTPSPWAWNSNEPHARAIIRAMHQAWITRHQHSAGRLSPESEPKARDGATSGP